MISRHDHRSVLAAWYRSALEHLPAGTEVWDAHSHTGDSDPDGHSQSARALLASLDRAGHTGVIVCSSADPGGYPANNDRILGESAASEGRLVPFLRVDPTSGDPAAEVERCLDLGHRGIKLHPRSERFALSHPNVDAVAAVAAEAGAPLLIHAGRGIPSLGADVIGLADRHRELTVILAHCAISDLALIASADTPRILVDTAWWNPADHLAVFSWVDSRRIVYASDAPYGRAETVFTLALRAAVQSGLDARAIAGVFGGTICSMLEGSPSPVPPGRGRESDVDLGLLRVAGYLHSAASAELGGHDAGESLELAIRVADRPTGRYRHVHEVITATLETAATARRGRISLILCAMSAALTPDVGMPDL